jgi:hypothetical protein
LRTRSGFLDEGAGLFSSFLHVEWIGDNSSGRTTPPCGTSIDPACNKDGHYCSQPLPLSRARQNWMPASLSNARSKNTLFAPEGKITTPNAAVKSAKQISTNNNWFYGAFGLSMG